MEVDGGIKRDVAVQERLAALGDEVPAHRQEHIGKQEGDGRR